MGVGMGADVFGPVKYGKRAQQEQNHQHEGNVQALPEGHFFHR